MALLTTQRNTPEKPRDLVAVPVEANTYIYLGAMVALDANGYAVPAQPFGAGALAALRVLGRAERIVGGTPGTDANNLTSGPYGGAAGAVTLVVRRGLFLLDNDGTITQTQVGQVAFASDDHTASVGAAVTGAVQAIGTTPAGSILKLAGRPIVRGSVVVTSDPAGTTYQEGQDYVVDYDGGALMLPIGTTIPASVNVLLSYVHGAGKPVLGRIMEYTASGVWIDVMERFGVSQL